MKSYSEAQKKLNEVAIIFHKIKIGDIEDLKYIDDTLERAKKEHKLLELYRKADKIRSEMYESVDQNRINTLMKIMITNQEEIDKLEAELNVF